MAIQKLTRSVFIAFGVMTGVRGGCSQEQKLSL